MNRVKHTNWFTIASVASIATMIGLGLYILVTPHETTIDDLAALVILGFSALVAAVFAIHDALINRFAQRDAQRAKEHASR